MDSRTALVEDLMERFPHVPREAVFKEDLLRGGLAFDSSALSDNEDGEVKPKSYFIFSFDHGTLPELGEAALRRPPEEIILTGGPYDLRRTVVSVRVNPASPYRVAADEDGVLGLYLDGKRISDVGVPPMPEYYRHTLANGKSVMEVAPTIQWGYLIYLTAFRVCQYFGAKEECQYCDINHNWRQHKAAGRPYTGVKDVDEVLEALEIIDKYDTAKVSTAYTLTGGAITSKVQGLDEADFYGRYAKAIEEHFPGRWIGKVVAQALPKDDVQRFKDYGVQIYHPNYEVWDEYLFKMYCPGKERYVGRDEWHKRILDSADIFGARNVIPNFVAACGDGRALRLHHRRRGHRVHHRGPALLHVARHHTPLHHLVPRADHPARQGQPAGRAAGVPHPAAGGLPRHHGRLRPGLAPRLRPARSRPCGLLRQFLHGQPLGGRAGRGLTNPSRAASSGFPRRGTGASGWPCGRVSVFLPVLPLLLVLLVRAKSKNAYVTCRGRGIRCPGIDTSGPSLRITQGGTGPREFE